MMRGIEVAAAVANELGEAPIWNAAGDALFWVDIRSPAVWRLDASGRCESWPMPELCGGLVLAGDGRLAVGLLSRVELFDLTTGERAFLATVEPASFANRLNEAKCDASGRLWIGSMRDFAAATTGALYRLDARNRPVDVSSVLTGITVPNAIAWSPDNRTMYFTDTADGRIRAYDFDLENGLIGAMRVLVDADVIPGKPDGVAVDEEGCLWNARFGAGCLARITPTGAVDRVVELPVSQPTACAFGGSDLRTLYVTSARQRMAPEALAAEPLAGALLMLDVGRRGLPASPLRLGA